MKLRLFHMLALSTLILSALLPNAIVHASTYVVTNLNNSGSGSLRHAIASASDGDTITFSVTGTIYLQSQLIIQHNITVNGPGAGKLILSGNNATRVFYINSFAVASISGITMTGGYVKASSGTADGAGIYNIGNLTLTNVVVKKNKAYASGTVYNAYGGGIYNGGTLTINTSQITNNSTIGAVFYSNYTFGGGIANRGTLIINNSNISNNKASFQGGGIFSDSGTVVTLNNSRLAGNTTKWVVGEGGAIYIYSQSLAPSTVTMDNVSIDQNSAGVAGGGLGIAQYATVTIEDSSITNNKLIDPSEDYKYGAGLSIQIGSTVDLTNVTVSGNTSLPPAFGGGFYAYDAILELNNITISNNSATTGGGVYIEYLTAFDFQNTLISNNNASSSGPDCYSSGGTINSQDYNLIGDLTNCSITGTTTHNITNVNPQLAPLGYNGGTTLSQSLLIGSPALDAGDNSTCAATDQRTKSRPQDGDQDGNATCDIGAFEDTPASISQATLYSQAASDGWVLESTSGSGVGGSLNYTNTTINIGDSINNQQFRGFLSFPTKKLADNAVVVGATLRFVQKSASGDSSSLGNLVADLKSPYFGSSKSLEISDFQDTAEIPTAFTFGAPNGNTYSATIDYHNIPALVGISLTGTTQTRIYFSTPTNSNNTMDVIKVFSGENTLTADKPALIIQYYIP